MSHSLYIDETPADVKHAKARLRHLAGKRYTNDIQGIHLVTMNTPNGQAGTWLPFLTSTNDKVLIVK